MKIIKKIVGQVKTFPTSVFTSSKKTEAGLSSKGRCCFFHRVPFTYTPGSSAHLSRLLWHRTLFHCTKNSLRTEAENSLEIIIQGLLLYHESSMAFRGLTAAVFVLSLSEVSCLNIANSSSLTCNQMVSRSYSLVKKSLQFHNSFQN